jgi:hypothetical protein
MVLPFWFGCLGSAFVLPKWGPQRETRQTVREGLNDVWVRGRSASNRNILKYNGISQINGS